MTPQEDRQQVEANKQPSTLPNPEGANVPAEQQQASKSVLYSILPSDFSCRQGGASHSQRF